MFLFCSIFGIYLILLLINASTRWCKINLWICCLYCTGIPTFGFSLIVYKSQEESCIEFSRFLTKKKKQNNITNNTITRYIGKNQEHYDVIRSISLYLRGFGFHQIA